MLHLAPTSASRTHRPFDSTQTQSRPTTLLCQLSQDRQNVTQGKSMLTLNGLLTIIGFEKLILSDVR